tara:strand:- start:319 stop:549 length:231 start_codon:yes stop_codon:yes gene_type:complete
MTPVKLLELGREERFKLLYPAMMILVRDPEYFINDNAWKFMKHWEDGDAELLYEVLKEIYEIKKKNNSRINKLEGE